jgi:hypothetical protein
MDQDKRRELTWHPVTESRLALFALQETGGPRDVSSRQLFYYAKQVDIERIFGNRAWPDDTRCPEEFDGLMGGARIVFGTIERKAGIIIAGENELREEGFSVPEYHFGPRREQTQGKPGIKQSTQCTVG